MILAVDCGNTNIVLACLEDGRVCRPEERLPTDAQRSAEDYAASLREILARWRLADTDAEGAVISSVVPALTGVLGEAVQLVTGRTALVVGDPDVRIGMGIRIDPAETLAGDLIAAAVAARQECPLPCIIVDLGTATTITVVDRQGDYIGGAILAGVKLSIRALAGGTAQLPAIDLTPPERAISVTTADSLRSGAIYGAAGAVDGIIDRFARELGEVGSIVATGGLSPLICPCCRHEMRLERDLLLRGLWYIWQANRA
jgi:type III pantothenate kinase